MNPLVSFVVPCYRLAHLLRECVDSILRQSYANFEILILDDCSPDNTPEVARSYTDPRVRYIRNDSNLGHLRNYNKGISLAQGEYVWLISADDCLRRPYILDRYVQLMVKHPNIGFVFCPAVGLGDRGETEVLKYSMRGSEDTIFPGREFLSNQLLNSDCVVVASAMARKDCYSKLSFYPLDMPYAGDWYMWCLFALHYDVGYLSEAMVLYREHGLSMTNSLKQQSARILIEDDLAVLWRIWNKVDELGLSTLVERCYDALANRYVLCASREVHDLGSYRLPIVDCIQSVKRNAKNLRFERRLLARIFTRLADGWYWQGNYSGSLDSYCRSLSYEFVNVGVWLKIALLKAGGTGISLRRGLLDIRRSSAKAEIQLGRQS